MRNHVSVYLAAPHLRRYSSGGTYHHFDGTTLPYGVHWLDRVAGEFEAKF